MCIRDRTLVVCNPIQAKLTGSAGPGIGLDNLSKRYQLLGHREVAISMDNGRFCVRIPLLNPCEI